jgi:FAD/FMN-containing dehydrogenase
MTRAPRAVIECADADAIVGALSRTVPAPVAVRGAGLSPYGAARAGDAVVLSLRGAASINVNPGAGRVRVGAGVTALELDAALEPYGLCASLPSPAEAGVLGSVLAGGVGLTTRRQGLVCDGLVSALAVTPAGDVAEVDDCSDPELMWGLRGAGAQLAVVVEAELRVAPIPELTVTTCAFEQASFAAVLRRLREWGPALAPDATVVVMVGALPPLPGLEPRLVGRTGVFVIVSHCGEKTAVQADLAGLLTVPGLLAHAQRRGSSAAHRRAAQHGGSLHEFGVATRSGWLDVLHEQTVERLVGMALALPPGDSLLEVGLLGGAIADPPAPSAVARRNAAYLVNCMAMWPHAGDRAPGARDEALRWLPSPAAMAEACGGPAAVPVFADAGDPSSVAAAYGAGLGRLRVLKDRCDPAGRLRGLFDPAGSR